MKHSSSTAAQQRGIETMVELQQTIKAMNLGEAQEMAELLRQMPAAFVEVMAKELTPLLTAQTTLIQQSRDVTEHLKQTMLQSKGMILKADGVITSSTVKLEAAQNALKAIQPPRQTLLQQALPYLILGALGLNTLMLVIVLAGARTV